MYTNGKSLWEILIPLRWNSGEQIVESHHREWEENIKGIASGLTTFGIARGQWNGPDGFQEEFVAPIRILCSSSDIRSIASMTLEWYQQVEIMYYLISSEIHFLRKR